jgi:hypothetical protein
MSTSTWTSVSTTKIANATVAIATERMLDLAAIKEEALISTDVPPQDAARRLEDAASTLAGDANWIDPVFPN